MESDNLSSNGCTNCKLPMGFFFNIKIKEIKKLRLSRITKKLEIMKYFQNAEDRLTQFGIISPPNCHFPLSIFNKP